METSKAAKILAAARTVFLRHGYRRVTMGDLAAEAKISRPSLYLVFPSKEAVFIGVVQQVYREIITEVRQDISKSHEPHDRLMFAFEVWSVRPFALSQVNPAAGDLLQSSLEVAAQITDSAVVEFEDIIAQIFAPLIPPEPQPRLSALEISRVLIYACLGFKSFATSPAQLRQYIHQMCLMALMSIGTVK